MDYRNYKTIQVMKKSDRAEVIFAAVNGLDMPVVVKRLRGANAEIYRTIAKIKSPHIPKTYFVEEQATELCVVEEYVDGRTLDVYLAETELTDVQKLELGVQLCEALEALHQCAFPIIHRDIKPSNILITEDGVLKIIDFDASRQYKVEKNTSDTRLLGTIEYAAPEQFGYTQTDVRSDVYSVGVVFSEIKMAENAPFLKKWKCLIDKSTSFDPGNRYKNVSELKKKIEKCIKKAKRSFGVRGLLSGAGKRGVVSDAMESTDNEKEEVVFGYETGVVSFRMNQCTCVDATAATYRINANESVSVRYERLYGEMIMELPTPVALKYCKDFIVKMKSEVGKITIKFYDEECKEVSAFYAAKTKRAEEMDFLVLSVPEDCRIRRIGFVAEDGELLDYSNFETVLYSIGFQFLVEDTEALIYRFDEMVPGEYYNTEYTYLDDGRLQVKFADIYGELRLELPEPVDMSQCVAVTIKLRSKVGKLFVKLYDAAYDPYNAVEEFHDICTYAVQDKLFTTNTTAMVVGVGLMANDMDLEDYSDFEATLFQMTFHMRKMDRI